MSETKIADVWEKELSEAPPAVPEAEVMDMTFAGLPCKVRPLSLEFYMRSGRMPDFLARISMRGLTPQVITEEFDAASPIDVIEGNKFLRRALCEVLEEPRVVEVPEGKEPEGAFSFMKLAEKRPKFINQVYFWILLGCPPPRKEGESEGMDAEALANFPEKPRRRQRAGTGNRRTKKRAATVRTDAADKKRNATV